MNEWENSDGDEEWSENGVFFGVRCEMKFVHLVLQSVYSNTPRQHANNDE